MRCKASVLLCGAVAVLVGACSTTPKITIDQCPPGESYPEYVQVPPPLLTLADQPKLTSDWTEAAADADPEGWLESVLADFQAVVNAWLEDRKTIIDSNATRPTADP